MSSKTDTSVTLNNPSITKGEIWQTISALNEFQAWPGIGEALFPSAKRSERISFDWQLPMLAYKFITGSGEKVLKSTAAMACVQISIILVDDILDEEPEGIYQQLGSGETANLALALQAASSLLLAQCEVNDAAKISAVVALNRMILRTAAGQQLDTSNLTTEKDYWHVVSAKSSPYYGASLEIGASLANCSKAVNESFYQIGATLGEMIQISDDLEDAFTQPANADWVQGRNNLAILYGLTADHPYRDSFIKLKPRHSDVDVLNILQQILIDSGALSYCIYKLIERRKFIGQQIAMQQAPYAKQLEALVDTQLQPAKTLLKRIAPEIAMEDLW
ncbi:hypothetical protein GC175_07605 [bacterium]|nr:hypothetical protein [bacterium]